MLPIEREMMGRFGVGRPTLREALRLLESRGVITIKAGPRGGPVVRNPRPEDLGDSLALVLEFAGATFLDLHVARTALEPVAARLAASNRTDADLEGLETAHRATPGDQPEPFGRQSLRFHELILDASRSPVLSILGRGLHEFFEAVAASAGLPDQRERAVEDHERLLEAIRSRDGAEAERLMRGHLEASMEFWLARSPRLLAQPVRWQLWP